LCPYTPKTKAPGSKERKGVELKIEEEEEGKEVKEGVSEEILSKKRTSS